MAEVLKEFLEQEASKPSRFWGERDCLLFASSWILYKRGVDPRAPYRGRYSTELGCLRILKREGGVAGILDARTAACGIRETDDPQDGDLVMIRAPALLRNRVVVSDAGAIRIGVRSAIMTPDGLVFLNVPWVKAWKI